MVTSDEWIRQNFNPIKEFAILIQCRIPRDWLVQNKVSHRYVWELVAMIGMGFIEQSHARTILQESLNTGKSPFQVFVCHKV